MKIFHLFSLLTGATMMLAACGSGNNERSSAADSTATTQDKAKTEDVKPAKTWQTEKQTDEMTDKEITLNFLVSDEQAIKDTNSAIVIKDGKEAFLTFDYGVVQHNLIHVTHNVNHAFIAAVKARFDGGSVQEFLLDTRETDMSRKYKVINPKPFIDACKKATEIKIQYNTHDDGPVTYKYTTEKPLAQE